jgi:hypothetical protein
MFETHLAALRFTLATFVAAAFSVGTASAQSAGNSDDQWRPAGVVRSTNAQPAVSSAPAPDNQPWRLPNGGQPANAGVTTDDAANPLRQKEKPKQKPAGNSTSEPRSFEPPTNAKKIATSQSAAIANPKQPVQQQRSPAALVTKPSVTPASATNQAYSQQVYNQPRQPQSRQQPTNGMVKPQSTAYQPPSTMMQRPNPANGGMWDSITVAFQGDAAPPKQSSESLPMPSEKSVKLPGNSGTSLPDPVMKHFDGPGAFIGPYQPPCCGPGECCDGSCNSPCGGGPYCGNCPCGDGCPGPSCGCGCQGGEPCCGEPSCGEPSCGCPNDADKDLFSLGPGDNESCHTIRLRWPKWQEVEAFAGVQGFKDPYSHYPTRDSGNFGFNQGFNIGAKVPYAALGYQFGYRITEDELSGDATSNDSNSFTQQFATAGLFHRQAEGLNFGIVWDVLSDERYTTMHYNQVRGELSIRDGGCHEIGVDVTVGLNSHDVLQQDPILETSMLTSFEASDQYLLFYRYHGECGGEGRFFAGCNNNSDALVGADMNLPIGERFCVTSGFEYLIPSGAPNGFAGSSQEAWNISLGLVWHWDGQAHRCFDNCYRPLFNVADNGSLIVDQQ